MCYINPYRGLEKKFNKEPSPTRENSLSITPRAGKKGFVIFSLALP